MSHINQQDISKRENRTLTKWQPLIQENKKLNCQFGKNFESWFNDRFNFRSKIIGSYKYITYKIQKVTFREKQRLIKKNGYMFQYYPEDDRKLSDRDIRIITANLYRLYKLCEDNNIKLYIFITPSVNVYHKKYDLTRNSNVIDNRIDRLQKAMKEKYNIEIFYPEQYFRDNENNKFVYFKTDHHLTDWGAYLYYKYIMDKMIIDFPDLKITPLSDYNSYKRNYCRYNYTRIFDGGAIYRALGINDEKLLTTEYDYYDYKYPDRIKITDLPGDSNRLHVNNNGKHKLMIIGDSFQENLVFFLDTSYKEIYKFRINGGLDYPKRRTEFDIKGWEPLIKEIKPDAIIITQHTGLISRFKRM